MAATQADRRVSPAPSRRRRLGPCLVLQRSLHDRRRSLLSWCLGTATYLGLIVAFWPSIRGSSEIVDAIENYPEAMKEFFGGADAFDYTKPGGYLNTQLFSLMLPLLLSALAMGYGSSTIAGEERAGQMDLLLALPVRRARVVIEKAAAMLLAILAMTAVSVLVMVGIGAAVDLDIAAANIVAACIGSGLVAMLHGSVALTVGAATGNRALALGTSSALFAAGYLLQALSGLVESLDGIKQLSALYQANGTIPINNGLPILRYLLLGAISVGLSVSALWLFDRRDLTV